MSFVRFLFGVSLLVSLFSLFLLDQYVLVESALFLLFCYVCVASFYEWYESEVGVV